MSGGRPQMLMCYLCGREFGSRSLPIHVPQCEKKWLAQESNKPAADRKALPPRPERLNAILAGNNLNDQERARFNEEMYNNYDQDVLDKCPWCGRTFTAHAMAIHAKSCTEDSPAKPAGTGLTKASLSNTLHGKTYGTRHRDSETSMDLPGRPSSPKRAASVKKLRMPERSGSKGPKQAQAPTVSFQPEQTPQPVQPFIYKDASAVAYPARAPVVLYSNMALPHGATAVSTPPAAMPPAAMPPAMTLLPMATSMAPAPGHPIPATVPSAPALAATTPRAGSKAANFCSECGTKFVTAAKFCHECGALRPGTEPPARAKFCHACGSRAMHWSQCKR